MKNKRFAFRIRERDLNAIRRRAKAANLSVTDFFTTSALGKEIVVVEGLPEIISQLKAIGNNLNQLTVLANMNRIQMVGLEEITDKLGDIHAELRRITEVL